MEENIKITDLPEAPTAAGDMEVVTVDRYEDTIRVKVSAIGTYIRKMLASELDKITNLEKENEKRPTTTRIGSYIPSGKRYIQIPGNYDAEKTEVTVQAKSMGDSSKSYEGELRAYFWKQDEHPSTYNKFALYIAIDAARTENVNFTAFIRKY